MLYIELSGILVKRYLGSLTRTVNFLGLDSQVHSALHTGLNFHYCNPSTFNTCQNSQQDNSYEISRLRDYLSSVKSYFASDMDVFMGFPTSYHEGFLGVTANSIAFPTGMDLTEVVPYCQLFNGCSMAATWLVTPTWVIHEVTKSLHMPGAYSQPTCLSDLCTAVHTSNVSMRDVTSICNQYLFTCTGCVGHCTHVLSWALSGTCLYEWLFGCPGPPGHGVQGHTGHVPILQSIGSWAYLVQVIRLIGIACVY